MIPTIQIEILGHFTPMSFLSDNWAAMVYFRILCDEPGSWALAYSIEATIYLPSGYYTVVDSKTGRTWISPLETTYRKLLHFMHSITLSLPWLIYLLTLCWRGAELWCLGAQIAVSILFQDARLSFKTGRINVSSLMSPCRKVVSLNVQTKSSIF